MSGNEIWIAGAARTPMGSFCGELAGLSSPQLGARAIAGALRAAAMRPDAIDQLFMGCVLPAGLGQAPARQASRLAGVARHSGATTINKMCGSGMQAVILAHDAIRAGSGDRMIAGGMESMSNAPYLLERHRRGARIGHDQVVDSLYRDGLEDAEQPGVLMGRFAEASAKANRIGREAQDDYALESLRRVCAAMQGGSFGHEIVPVDVPTRDGAIEIAADEQPRRAKPDRVRTLAPSFAQDGTITPASSSSISDGAVALLVSRAASDWPSCARIVGHEVVAAAPDEFPELPARAISQLLRRLEWRAGQVDLFEVNEAFAMVPLLTMRMLAIAHDRMNVHGGACALGHPIGASGARILVTLLNAMTLRGARRGIAAICLGGGEALALALERG